MLKRSRLSFSARVSCRVGLWQRCPGRDTASVATFVQDKVGQVRGGRQVALAQSMIRLENGRRQMSVKYVGRIAEIF